MVLREKAEVPRKEFFLHTASVLKTATSTLPWFSAPTWPEDFQLDSLTCMSANSLESLYLSISWSIDRWLIGLYPIGSLSLVWGQGRVCMKSHCTFLTPYPTSLWVMVLSYFKLIYSWNVFGSEGKHILLFLLVTYVFLVNEFYLQTSVHCPIGKFFFLPWWLLLFFLKSGLRLLFI